MKNWGKFFILVMTLFTLISCSEKGSGGGGGTSIINPYSWDELYEMINTSEETQIYSRYTKNKEEISNLAKEPDIKDNDLKKTYISDLVSSLEENVYIPIVTRDKDFNYYSAVRLIEYKNNNLVDVLGGVLSYDDLVLLLDELNKITINTPDAITYDTLTDIRSKLDETLSLIRNRKAINPFYADAALVYYQYVRNININKDFLKDNYEIDIDAVDQTSNIQEALNVLISDIGILENKAIYEEAPFPERQSLLSQMNLLKNTYQNYLNGNVSLSDVETMRGMHRDVENGIVVVGNISDYIMHIDNILSDLKNLDTSDNINSTNLKNELIGHIEDYQKINAEYDKKNYLVISSKVANVIKEWAYLKNSNIITLDIDLPWN
jgi:hypothetical protein